MCFLNDQFFWFYEYWCCWAEFESLNSNKIIYSLYQLILVFRQNKRIFSLTAFIIWICKRNYCWWVSFRVHPVGLNGTVSPIADSTHPNTSVVLNILEMKMYSNINDNRPAAEVFRLDIAAVVSPGMENTFFSKNIFSVFNYILIFFLILCSSMKDSIRMHSSGRD